MSPSRPGLLLLCALAFGFILPAGVHAARVAWPAPDAAFFRGEPLEAWVQPTASGRTESALFGCTRNGGNRFHEGLDIAAKNFDRRGESTDPCFAVMDGTVAYINPIAGNSSYGRYVVLVHDRADVPLYSLYAHLRSIEPGLEPGAAVLAGSPLGTIGRSAAGYSIPRSRSHVHFEIGVRLTDGFQAWYDKQPYGSENQHGLWNGMNLLGLDPLVFFNAVRERRFNGFRNLLYDLPAAFTLRVSTTRVPDFITRYSHLLATPIPREGVAGWDIDFTWFGLPKRWIPLDRAQPVSAREGDVAVVRYNAELLDQSCRETLIIRDGRAFLGDHLKTTLRLLFGY